MGTQDRGPSARSGPNEAVVPLSPTEVVRVLLEGSGLGSVLAEDLGRTYRSRSRSAGAELVPPANVRAHAIEGPAVVVSWSRSLQAVEGYVVGRPDEPIGSVEEPRSSYFDTAVQRTTYAYTVSATSGGRVSTPSEPFIVDLSEPPPPPPPPPAQEARTIFTPGHTGSLILPNASAVTLQVKDPSWNYRPTYEFPDVVDCDFYGVSTARDQIVEALYATRVGGQWSGSEIAPSIGLTMSSGSAALTPALYGELAGLAGTAASFGLDVAVRFAK
jgi:hypothetical protein